MLSKVLSGEHMPHLVDNKHCNSSIAGHGLSRAPRKPGYHQRTPVRGRECPTHRCTATHRRPTALGQLLQLRREGCLDMPALCSCSGTRVSSSRRMAGMVLLQNHDGSPDRTHAWHIADPRHNPSSLLVYTLVHYVMDLYLGRPANLTHTHTHL